MHIKYLPKKAWINNLIIVFLAIQVSFVSASENPYLVALPLWQNTLDRFVDEQGKIDFVSLANDSQDLEKFITAIAEVSPDSHPELFPSQYDVLAYHVNAYNGLAMWGVIERDIPANFSSLWKRASFFKFRKIIIGGKKTNLYDYENKVIRPLDEPRMHFVLNCMVKDCPRLPKVYFLSATLERDLQGAAVEFFNTSKNVELDAERQEVKLSSILKFYTKDYVASGKKQDLIAYVNQYREEKIPTHYKVQYLPYDWTINQL